MPTYSEGTDLGYLIGVVRRRFWQMVLPAFGLFLVVAVVVMLLPAKYQSSATILIEGQEVPQELVASAVTGYVDERLQSITQVVLNRTNLLSIIDRVGLYARDRKNMTAEELVDMMRKSITMEPITAEVMSNTGRAATATIAFAVSFEGDVPAQVLQTTNILVSLFMEENLKKREAKATTAYTFLEKQQATLREEVATAEARIARFKEEHFGELPELTQLNMQTLERIERQIDAIQEGMRGLNDRRAFLEGQLATVSPQRTLVTADGNQILPPSDELRALKARYVSLSATHSDKHPDVVRLREQIAALEGSGVDVDLEQELEAEKTKLTRLQGKYGEAHPDVQAAERRVAALEKQRSSGGHKHSMARSISENTDNPAWVALKSQLQATDTDLSTQQATLEDLRRRQEELIQRLERAPRVEQDYRLLDRDLAGALAKYQETSQKLLAARESRELEEERVGEKLTILDPPMLPEKPSKPKRGLLLLVGCVLSLGFGAGCGALGEALDNSVRGARGLSAITDVQILGVIPYIETSIELSRRRRNRWLIALALVLALIGCIGLVHVFVRPLDILYFQLMTRFFG